MLLPFESLQAKASAFGFSHCSLLDVSTIVLQKEVRDMCEANTCRQYDRTWCCPPGLGSLEECTARIRKYQQGILVQTVGKLEDQFDYDSMMETQRRHQATFDQMHLDLLGDYPALLALGAGGCSRCKACTYPDEPCRHPDLACGSMEAYGMVVTQVCRANGLAYYYGQNTIAYTSCFLLL